MVIKNIMVKADRQDSRLHVIVGN